MKKQVAKILASVLVLGALAPMAACGGKSAQETYDSVKSALAAIEMYNGSMSIRGEMKVEMDDGLMAQQMASETRTTRDVKNHVYASKGTFTESEIQRTKSSSGWSEVKNTRVSDNVAKVAKIGESYYDLEYEKTTDMLFQNGVKDETQTSSEVELEVTLIPQYETHYAVQEEVKENFGLDVNYLFGGLFQFEDAAEVQAKLTAVAAAEQKALRDAGNTDAVVTVKMELKDDVYALKVQQVTHERDGETLVSTTTMTHLSKLVVKNGKISKIGYALMASSDFVSEEQMDSNVVYSIEVSISYSFNKKWYNEAKIPTPTPEQLSTADTMTIGADGGKYITFTDVEGKPCVWMYGYQSDVSLILQQMHSQGIENLYFDEACTKPVTAQTTVREWNAANVLYTKEAQIDRGFVRYEYAADTQGWQENYDVLAQAPEFVWETANTIPTTQNGKTWIVNGQPHTADTLEIAAGQVVYVTVLSQRAQPTIAGTFFPLGV